jgi:hypothetical protein
MHRIIQKIWISKGVVKDWQTATIIPLFKKGDVDICDNYRGISLLSIPSKVLAKILYRRIEKVTESKLDEAQCGFRAGRGCVDQIFNLKQCLSMARERRKPILLCFVDLKKAYDSVNRRLLWDTLAEYGISRTTIKILNSLYDNSRAQVKVNGSLSDFLYIKTGVLAGLRVIAIAFQRIHRPDYKCGEEEIPKRWIQSPLPEKW